jgi:hypothetical protein
MRMKNSIVVGESYISDGQYGTFVVATNDNQLQEKMMDIGYKYHNVREVSTNNKYQPDDMFID